MPPCYFLEIAPFFYPVLIKEGGLRAKPHISPAPLFCLSPVCIEAPLLLLNSLVCFVVDQPLFLAHALPDQTYIYLLGFFGFAYISTAACCFSFCPPSHPLFHSVSRWTRPIWKNPSLCVNGKTAMATDAHIALPFPF